MLLEHNQRFESRADIGDILGGNHMQGITHATETKAILLFTNKDELYTDYFYPKKCEKDPYKYCLYTGIGRNGNQDSLIDNKNYYYLNIDVLNHQRDNRALLLFEKRKNKYHFIGEYKLTEVHQNIKPDDKDNLRRVFVFHIEKIKDTYQL